MKPKYAAFLLILLLVCGCSDGGGVFDKAVDVKSEYVSHILSDNEFVFTPTGESEYFWISEPELTLQLKYATGTIKLSASQKNWNKFAPLKVALPNGLGYSGLQSYKLTGKFRLILKVKDKKVSDDPTDIKNWDTLTGYKIDSEWFAK